MPDTSELIEAVKQLIQLEECIKNVALEDYENALNDYMLQIARIRDGWLDRSMIVLPAHTDAAVVRRTSEILSGQGTDIERCIRDSFGVTSLNVAIYPDETLSREHYWEQRLAYPMVDAWSYTRGIMEIGCLVLAKEFVPSLLPKYAEEAREAYGRCLYQAVLTLSRAIVEICLKDLAEKNDIIRVSGNGRVSSLLPFTPPLSIGATWLLENICELVLKYQPFQIELNSIIQTANPIAHAAREVDQKEACSVLQRTFKCIEDIYRIL